MTLRFVLIGHPVGHSMSPVMHHAAYGALGLDAEYAARDCPNEDAVRDVLEEMRAGAIEGANVTVPWKRTALALADEPDALAETVGAANVLARSEGARVRAYNTDVTALVDELRPYAGDAPAAVVLGSGGAARAVVAACRQLGASDVTITARRWTGPASTWPGAEAFRALGASPVAWPDASSGEWGRAVARCRLLVQATSAGMKGADSGGGVRDAVPWSSVPRDAVAYDLVYNPPTTPFLEAAERTGIRAIGGLGMLVGQAARSIELWTGRLPPTAPMLDAARRALEET